MSLTNLAASYLSEIWTKDGDPFVLQLFLVGPPWKFLSLLLTMVFVLKALEQSNRKPSDTKHLRLVYSGFFFGVNGIGTAMGFVTTNWGTHALMCLDRDDLSLQTIAIRYLGYVYLITLVGDMLYELFFVLEGRRYDLKDQAWSVSWALCVYAGFVFYPTGHFAFCPLLHCFVRIFFWGAEVMANSSLEPSDGSSPSNGSSKSKLPLDILMVIMWAAMFVQQVFFYMVVRDCGCKTTSLALCTYAAAATLKRLLNISWTSESNASSPLSRTFKSA